MGSISIPTLNLAAPAVRTDDPSRVRDAARQFESLLIGQILHSAREGGWLGTPEDASSNCATDYAEQQFAAVMAQAGGLGIARMVERGLRVPTPLPER
jgi:Rod binding domain-containing protein